MADGKGIASRASNVRPLDVDPEVHVRGCGCALVISFLGALTYCNMLGGPDRGRLSGCGAALPHPSLSCVSGDVLVSHSDLTSGSRLQCYESRTGTDLPERR